MEATVAATAGAATLVPADVLAEYRVTVEEAARHLEGTTGSLPVVVSRVLSQPGLRAVLEAVPGAAVDRIEREVRAFRPSSRSNASDPSTLLRILLLHQVDVLWWSGTRPFADDDAVRASPLLTSLARLRREGRLGFRYRVAPTALPGRARNYAVRRWAPEIEPRSSGLSHGMARPAVVGLLNEVAAHFAATVPQWRRGLWVNCIVRSVADQRRLRELGYSAFLPSSHCAGFAADIEMAWLRRHAIAEPLQQILLRYRDTGVLNVIDEGQAWHVCLNPARVAQYAQAAPR